MHFRRQMGLRQMAQQLKHHGTGGDDVLAHINPHEAQYLQHHEGMSINPHTGLPEFGFWRKAEKFLRKPFKAALPIAGAFLGNMMAPGLGGSMVGGGIGGALSSKKHPLQHALGGALMGGAGSLAFGGGELPEFMKSALPGAGTTAAATKHLGNIGDVGKKKIIEEVAKEGWGDKLMNFITKDPIQTGLLATTAIGALMSRPKYGKGDFGHKEGSLNDVIMTNRALRAEHEAPVRHPKPLNRKPIKYSPEQWFGSPGQLPFFEEANPETEYYAQGGSVQHHDYSHGGYVDGDDGGQSDRVPIEMKPGQYVMDATTGSLLGDGNPKKGAQDLLNWQDRALSSGTVNLNDYGDSHRVKAMVSPTETVLKEEFVTHLGKGDNSKGAKLLDDFRKRVRKQKGLKTFLPPKSKPIPYYLKGK